MRDAFICDAARTPIGRHAGALAAVRADDLAAVPIKALMARHRGLDWGALDDIVLGCANQAGRTTATWRAWPGCWPACPMACRAAPSTGSAARGWTPPASPPAPSSPARRS
ncbi:thiolase family protein [Teichococcus aestuarii]